MAKKEEEEGKRSEDIARVLKEIKDRTVHFEPSEPPIKELCDRITKNKLDLQAEFQRQYVWDDKPELKSKLIESVILRVPIPVIYTAELNDGRDVVVDGQQRLRTFYEFCKKDGFKLSKLEILSDWNGWGYKDLPSEVQDMIDSYPIRVIKILNDTYPDIKYDVFERLNRGSVKLTDQELRNCIYHGSFNLLIKELVHNTDFLRLQNLDDTHERMKDAERILRFFALCDRGIVNYQSPVRRFLNDYMDEKREINEDEKRKKTESFKKCAELCSMVFGNLAGHRWVQEDPNQPDGATSKNFNEGILDAQMVGFIEYSKHDITPKMQLIRDGFLDLLTKRQFIDTVELGTYGTKQTKRRMELWSRTLRDIMDYPSEDRRLYTYEEKNRLYHQKDGDVCKICKGRILDIDDAHVDHIERYVDGGKTTLKNAQLTHRYCNLEKG